VRGSDYLVDQTLKHGAIFLVWTEQSKWQDIPYPIHLISRIGKATGHIDDITLERTWCFVYQRNNSEFFAREILTDISMKRRCVYHGGSSCA